VKVRSLAVIASLFSLHVDAQPRRGTAQSPRYTLNAWRDQGHGAVRGATLGPIENTQHPGVGYGTQASAEALDELAALGCNWVSFTPFGRQWDLASTTLRMDFEAPWPENRRAVLRVIEQAHARGMHVLLIPHLWVDLGGWRGEIGEKTSAGAARVFTQEEWQRWFASYTRFVTAWARVAEEGGAEMFSVGVEMKSSSGTRGEWFDVINAVRAVYHGSLTYSANWEEERSVLFWDRLDVVGIQAFYPLAEREGATLDELRAGAQRRATALAQWATTQQRSVLFTEFGYKAVVDTTLRPWEWPDGMANVRVSARAQADGYRALLEAFAPQPWFAGGYVWRYYANPMDSSQEEAWGFSPRGRDGEAVLGAFYDPRVVWGADSEASSGVDGISASILRATEVPLYTRRHGSLSRLFSISPSLSP
jgi:hypothetical protein